MVWSVCIWPFKAWEVGGLRNYLKGSVLKLRSGVELWKVLSDLLILLNPIRVIARATGLINQWSSTERERGERCGEGNTHTYDNGERERREMRGGKHTHMIMERERGERCGEGNTHTYDNGEREERDTRRETHTHRWCKIPRLIAQEISVNF